MTIQDLQRKSKSRHSINEVWVSVGVVAELTIWDNHRKLELARRRGLIEQRKVVKGVKSNGEPSYKIQYRIDTVHELFLKK